MRTFLLFMLFLGSWDVANASLETTIEKMQNTITQTAPTALAASVIQQLPPAERASAQALDERSKQIEAATQAIENASTPQETALAQQQLLNAQQTPKKVLAVIDQTVSQLSANERAAYAQAQATFANN